MSFNPDSYPFITKELFENILRKEKNNEIIIVENIKLQPAVNKGENYSSALIRVIVNYLIENKEKCSTSFIVKTELPNEDFQDVMDGYNVFERESIVFRDILPKVHELLRKYGDETKLAPICYSVSMKPHYIIFEDLSLHGFKNSDRKTGLNFDHLQMVVKKLAKWHAATAMIYMQDPSLMKSHHYKNICQEVSSFHPVFVNALLSCADSLSVSPENKKLVEKLRNLSKTLIMKGELVFSCDETSFNCLSHGDVWVCNIMYKNDNHEKPEDVLMVDFQLGFWGSVGIDLSYLMFTSSADNMEEKEWDEILRIYSNELTAALKTFKYPKRIPTLTDIQIEFLKKSINGVIFALICVGVRFVENTEDADLSNLLLNTETALNFRKVMFGNPKYVKRMETILRYCDRKGILDGLEVNENSELN